MRRFGLLLLCLLASSLVATATVCAREAPGVELSCGGVTHAEEHPDGKGDRERAPPHHHGACHGHNFAVGVDATSVALPVPVAEAPAPARAARLTARNIDPALKPPRA